MATDKSKEAMKLALEALEMWCPMTATYLNTRDKAITALREALAEQPAQQQEPVAVVSGYYVGQCVILPIDPARIFNSGTALYTSPPAQRTWVGLTDEDVEKLIPPWDCWTYEVGHEEAATFARTIEAKLKEKNA